MASLNLCEILFCLAILVISDQLKHVRPVMMLWPCHSQRPIFMCVEVCLKMSHLSGCWDNGLCYWRRVCCKWLRYISICVHICKHMCKATIFYNEVVIGLLRHSQVLLIDHCTCVVCNHILEIGVHHSALLSSPLTPQTWFNINNHAFDSQITISLWCFSAARSSTPIVKVALQVKGLLQTRERHRGTCTALHKGALHVPAPACLMRSRSAGSLCRCVTWRWKEERHHPLLYRHPGWAKRWPPLNTHLSCKDVIWDFKVMIGARNCYSCSQDSRLAGSCTLWQHL